MCDSKKSRLAQKRKVSRLLSNLGLNTSLSKIRLSRDILF